MLTPVVAGTLFGTRALAGVLAGALVSGVQMAVSMSNTGGAWDNAKKYIEVCASYSYMYRCLRLQGLGALGLVPPLQGTCHAPAHTCTRLLVHVIHCAFLTHSTVAPHTALPPTHHADSHSTSADIPLLPFAACRPAPPSTPASWAARALTATRPPSSVTLWVTP